METIYNKTIMQEGYHRRMRAAFCSVIAGSVEWIAEMGLNKDSKGVFITFDVDATGVEIPEYLREQFPEGMTIILQHQYEDLKCDDKGFSVVLVFDGQPVKVRVPWVSIMMYSDETAEFAIDMTAYFDETAPAKTYGAAILATDSSEDEEAESEYKNNVVRLFPREGK